MKIIESNQYQSRLVQFKKTRICDWGKYTTIKYDGDDFYLKTPRLLVPFGVSNFKDQPDSVVVSFTDSDISEPVSNFQDVLMNIDKIIEDHFKDETRHKLSLFRSKPEYPWLCRFKLTKSSQGSVMTNVFDENNQVVDISYVQPGCHTTNLIKIDGVCETEEGYHCVIKVCQIRVFPPDNPFGKCLLNDREEEYSLGIENIYRLLRDLQKQLQTSSSNTITRTNLPASVLPPPEIRSSDDSRASRATPSFAISVSDIQGAMSKLRKSSSQNRREITQCRSAPTREQLIKQISLLRKSKKNE